MKAVILAAGSGIRIRQHHQLPKGFIKIDDKEIILHSLEMLNRQGIKEILLITGYCAEQYDLLAKQTGLFSTLYNKFYMDYSSLYSWYCARSWIDSDFLLLESDLLYEEKALSILLQCEAPDAILVSNLTNSGDEVFVTAEENMLTKMSKRKEQLEQKKIIGEFVGINKISYSAFRNFLEKLHKNPELLQSGHYEEDGLTALAKLSPVLCKPVKNLIWCEIDNFDHLKRAQTLYHRHLCDAARII